MIMMMMLTSMIILFFVVTERFLKTGSCHYSAENWFKPPMFFIDRTKAVIQHFLEKSFK